MFATLFEIPQSIFADAAECACDADPVEAVNRSDIEKSGRVVHDEQAMNVSSILSP
jgi:hypothetical protein